ncbi:MAG TPA: prepilin-type N-terminal cleavage/methylation domain-containing protein [Burkholderiaceae bacterium]|nr:prepilin-type N-terminal cleavage/methylation domain-containing protein [Burkholderiaceae bacterium]
MHRNTRFSRGVSLVEAMVALAVMAFGMLAVVGVQSTLRFNGDIAKQRSEATRLAQERIDDLRSFTAIDGAGGFDERVANAGPTPVTDLVTNTTYTVQSQVVTYSDTPARSLRVSVRWTDRAGGSQEVVVASAIAAAAPGLSGTLAVRPGTASVAPVRRPFKRHPTIPVQARDFGSSSAFVPPQVNPNIVIVFNNVTGTVIGVCNFNYNTSNETITIDEIQSCINTTSGQLVSGFIRFQQRSQGGDLTASDVENPPGPAMNLRMNMSLTSSGHPSAPFCIDDTLSGGTVSGQPFAAYYCVVYSNLSGTWSGITTVEPLGDVLGDWVITDDPGAPVGYRVCRYTSASSDSQPVANQDHPRNYADVSGNLTNQNFVVIRSMMHCPTDVSADPANGDLVDSNTLQHQPTPS